MAETQSEVQKLESFDTVDDLLTAYNEIKEDLNTARRCWREEFDKRKAVEKKYKQLGQGTGFLDCEKLRVDLHKEEDCEYQRHEKIVALTDELARQKAEAQYEIDKLILPHRNDKEEMKAEGYARVGDWENHLRNERFTEEIEDLESGYIEIQAKLEEKRKESKEAVLTIADLKRKLDIRLVFAEINNRPTVPCECIDEDKPVFKSPEETIKVI